MEGVGGRHSPVTARQVLPNVTLESSVVGSLVWRISVWKLLFDFLCLCTSVWMSALLIFHAVFVCVVLCVRVCVRERGIAYVFDMRFQFWPGHRLSSLTRKEEWRLSMTRLWSSSFKISVSP